MYIFQPIKSEILKLFFLYFVLFKLYISVPSPPPPSSDQEADLLEVAGAGALLGVPLTKLQLGSRRKGKVQEQEGGREEKLEVKRRRPNKYKVQEEPLDQKTNEDQEAVAEDDTLKHVEHKETTSIMEDGSENAPPDLEEQNPDDNITTGIKTETVLNKSPKCNQCNEEFKNNYYKSKHMNTVHSAASFDCNMCKETFSMEQYLKKHVTTHSDNPDTFHCALCNVGFKLSNQLKKHDRRAHSDMDNTLKIKIEELKPQEEQFNCESCDFKTPKLVFLKTHCKFMHLENSLNAIGFKSLNADQSLE